MKEYVKAYEKMTLVNAFIMLIVGIIMVLFPLKMMSLLITIISCFLVADGVYHLIHYAFLDAHLRPYSSDLLIGVFSIILGLVMGIDPMHIMMVLPLVFAIWIVMKALVKIQVSFMLVGTLEVKWAFLFLEAVVEILFAGIMILHPLSSLLSVTMIIGILLIIMAIIEIIETRLVIKRLTQTNGWGS